MAAITRQRLNEMEQLQKELNERGAEVLKIIVQNVNVSLLEARYLNGVIILEFSIAMTTGDPMFGHLPVDLHDFVADDYIERVTRTRNSLKTDYPVRGGRAVGVKTYCVIAGRYENDNGEIVENIKTAHTGLNAEDAKKIYHECRGYDFNRIEVDGIPDVDVSDELFGIDSTPQTGLITGHYGTDTHPDHAAIMDHIKKPT